MFETALEADEIVTAVHFPRPERAKYMKFRHPASRYAMAGVLVARMQGGRVRVAVTGAGPCAFRHAGLEAALSRSFTPDAVEGVAIDASNLNGDLHGSPEYRAHLVQVMARRAVEALV
jgi:carbon-monoxide dehydrogenase medium subunit